MSVDVPRQSENTGREPDADTVGASILHYLEDTRVLYTTYTHHKEAMAWAGVGAYVVAVSQTLGRFPNLANDSLTSFVVLTTFSAVAFLYVRVHFMLGADAANIEATCLKFIAEIVSGTAGPLNYSDFAPPTVAHGGLQSRHVLADAVLRRLPSMAKRGQGARLTVELLAYSLMGLALAATIPERRYAVAIIACVAVAYGMGQCMQVLRGVMHNRED